MINCVICGRQITTQKYAIRDYHNETHLQWIRRHIITLFKYGPKKRDDGKLAVCSQCAWRYINESIGGI